MNIYLAYIIGLVLLYMILKPQKYIINKKIFLSIAFVFLLLISCFRTEAVGADTKEYVRYFGIVKEYKLVWLFENFRYEKGFATFCKIISYISSNPQILIIASSIIIISSVFYFIAKNSSNIFLSILLFILLNYYFMYISAMRQAMAVAIILFGYTFFYKTNHNKMFILMILFASLFHTAALCALIIAMIPQKMCFNKKYFLLTILLSILAFVISECAFSFLVNDNQYSYYKNSEYSQGGNIAGYVNYIIALSIFFFSYVFGNKKIKVDKFFNNYLFVLAINLIITAFAIKISIFMRLTVYFNVFDIIFIPYVMNNIGVDNNKKIMKIIIYVSIFLYWFVISKCRPEWYGCIPYTSIL